MTDIQVRGIFIHAINDSGSTDKTKYSVTDIEDDIMDTMVDILENTHQSEDLQYAKKTVPHSKCLTHI